MLGVASGDQGLMGMDALLVGLVIVLLVGGLLAVLRGSMEDRAGTLEAHRTELERMPAEIANGRLVMSEDKLRAELGGVLVYGRSEQVYRVPSGELVPVESKTRQYSKVYDSDIIQTSLQAQALRATHRRVAEHGYVRTWNRRTKQVRYHRIQLLPERMLRSLVERYFDIIEGRRTPIRQQNRKACTSCQYKERCWPGGV